MENKAPEYISKLQEINKDELTERKFYEKIIEQLIQSEKLTPETHELLKETLIKIGFKRQDDWKKEKEEQGEKIEEITIGEGLEKAYISTAVIMIDQFFEEYESAKTTVSLTGDWLEEWLKNSQELYGKEVENKLSIPYYQVAKNILINRDGLSDEEAITRIQTLSFQKLESEVEAIKIISPVLQEMKPLFSEYGINILKQEIYEGKQQEDGVLAEVSVGLEDTGKDKDEFIMDILEGINFSETSKEKGKYVPFGLIGWDKAKKILTIIKPLMEAGGVEINEEELQAAYDKRLEELFLTDEEGLDSLLKIISQNPNLVDFRYVLPRLIQARRENSVEKINEIENGNVTVIKLKNLEELREEDLEKLTEDELSEINEQIMGIEEDVSKKYEIAKRKNTLIEGILSRANKINKMNKEIEELKSEKGQRRAPSAIDLL